MYKRQVRHLAGGAARADVLHPCAARADQAVWDGEALTVNVPGTPGVLLVRLTSEA